MRKLAGWTVLTLAIAACGGTTADSTTTLAPSVGPTTTSVESASTTSATPDTTTSAPAVSSGATFAITMISLGDLGQVVIQNVGDGPGSLGGLWLCQRPSYYEFPDVVLQPGESAAVSVGGDGLVPPPGAIAIEGIAAIGSLDPADGEVGLYQERAFDSPSAILSYVEWGTSGHGRSATAVSAGIWPDGGFVQTSADSGAILATTIPATDPTHWTGGS